MNPVKAFYNACSEFHAQDATWQQFKEAFRDRFEDMHSDQYNFTKLQTTRQAKNEWPQVSVDRCRGLSQKDMSKVSVPVAQRIHHKNVDRMCLASFVPC